MIYGAARVAPEKAVFRPALPMSFLPGITEIQMTPAVPNQAEINVFVNENGTISIQQECGMDDPSIVEIHPQNLDVLIRALREAKKNIKEEA